MIHNERSLVSELSIADICDDLVWGADGSVTLVYAVVPYHEPGLADTEVNALVEQAAVAWAGLPEDTCYQYYVLVSHRRAIDDLYAKLPPIPRDGAASDLLEELRAIRLRELTQIDETGQNVSLIQDRQHYLCATFKPKALQSGGLLAGIKGLFRPAVRDYEEIHQQIKQEAETFDRRVSRSLSAQGLSFARLTTPDIVQFVHELLNPTAAEIAPLRQLARPGADAVPPSILAEYPYLADVAPLWSAVDDDLLVRREYLRVGDRYVSVLTLKELPEQTQPAMLVPLTRMGREKFRIYFRLDVPRYAKELAALRARASMAEGLKLQNFIVKSERKDVHAEAVSKQTEEAMMRIIASGQRIFGVDVEITLIERSPEALEEAVQEVLGIMSRSHGLRGRRETYRLKPAWLAQLPGSPALVEHRLKSLTPSAVDLMPAFDACVTEGKVPFLTSDNIITFFDPFAGTQMNANVLITGQSGAGKSVAAQMLVSGYEIGALSQGGDLPYVYILDNGASYKRYMDCRPDARYVQFSFAEPPGVDIFAFEGSSDDEEGRTLLDEHVSRLEWLLLDLLRVDLSDEEAAETKKAAIEQALYTLYQENGPRSFHGFAEALARTPCAAEFQARLFPFLQGKFDRLFSPNPRLALSEDVHAICYDFKGLAEHPDLAGIALRLVVYEIRRFSAKMSRRRRRSFLVLDESWAMLDSTAGGSHVTSVAAPFLAASLRMGRKEGLSVIALSQQIDDFATSAYGAAILGNSATKLIGPPGREGIDSLRRHLRITERQADQVRRLTRGARHQEFLLCQGDLTNVIRVSLDPLSRWLFTTLPADRDRLDRFADARPDLSVLDRVRMLARNEAPV